MPLFFIISIILKFSGEKEIFYKQERIGMRQKKFQVYKFTTMKKGSENLGSGSITLKGDDRVFLFGKFLRFTKLNEFPQLINVLLGEMSFVGPRPLMIRQFNYYSESEKKIIASVRPGITGLGSILFRDEEKILSKHNNPHDFYKTNISPVKAAVEMEFISRRNIFLYFSIIILTLVSVILPQIRFGYLVNKELRERYECLYR